MKSRVCGPITSTQSLTVWFYFSFSLSTGSSLDGKVGRPTRVRERGGEEGRGSGDDGSVRETKRERETKFPFWRYSSRLASVDLGRLPFTPRSRWRRKVLKKMWTEQPWRRTEERQTGRPASSSSCREKHVSQNRTRAARCKRGRKVWVNYGTGQWWKSWRRESNEKRSSRRRGKSSTRSSVHAPRPDAISL